KSLNNNIILAKSKENEEFVLFGTGIGFKKKKGDLIDVKKATKIFQPKEDFQTRQLIEHIPIDVLKITEKIVSIRETKLKNKLNHSILFALADHLHFAIEKDNDFNLDNPIQWEVPYLYYAEHEVGKIALDIIEAELGYKLPEI